MIERPAEPARDRREHFDAWAASYDHQRAGEPEEFPFLGYHRVLQAAADEVARRRPARVIDLGVGTGNLAALIAERLPQAALVGLDYSAYMLEAARAKLPENALLLRARLGVDELPVGPLHGAAVAAATYALHELEPPAQAELVHTLLTRHLAPGGSVIVGDVAWPTTALRAQAHEHYRDRWDDEEHYFAADELRGRLEPKGVTVAYRQISPCAGLLMCELRRNASPAATDGRGPTERTGEPARN